ncbi:MAG TPA: PilZ domain-containing protein [Thermoanaerobaculia bacterium]|nr:PilZ domain-containing protein [Thermoanaerobaculia bacterium]
MEITELRQSERFVAPAPLSGSFGSHDVAIVNICDRGAMVTHAQPIRIGTTARLSFRDREIVVAATARVVWSRFANDTGTLVYQSGLAMQQEDPALADALRKLLSRHVLRRDFDSMDRKRKRLEEREKVRTGQKMTFIRTQPDVPHEQVLLVEHARTQLGGSSDAEAIYEYLQHTVDLDTIERVLARRA